MSTIIPHSELLRRAAAYISEQRQEHQDKPLHDVLDAAGMRFNLAPADYEVLLRMFAEQNAERRSPDAAIHINCPGDDL